MRRILGLTVCLMLLSCAMAEPFVVQYNGGDEAAGYSMMLSRDGAALTPAGEYYYIYSISVGDCADADRLYAGIAAEAPAGDGGPVYPSYSMALLNARGERLTGFDYQNLVHYPEDGVVVYTLDDGHQGALAVDGRKILDADFAGLIPNGQSGWLGLYCPSGEAVSDEGVYPLVYVDTRGRLFETNLHARRYCFSYNGFCEGLCVVSGVSEYGGQFIYLDPEGGLAFDRAFDRAFDSAFDFYGSYAAVMEDGLYGLIDRTGDYKIEPVWEGLASGSDYDAGLYIATGGGRFVLLDAQTGEEIASDSLGASSLYAWMENAFMVRVTTEDTAFMYDLDGRRLCEAGDDISAWYPRADALPQRLISSGDWLYGESRLVDLEGNAVGPAFQWLSAVGWANGKGLYIFQTFDVIGDGDGAYPGNIRYGLCDQDGNILLDAQYSDFEALSMDRFWVRQGNRCGMIDEDGNWCYVISDFQALMD